MKTHFLPILVLIAAWLLLCLPARADDSGFELSIGGFSGRMSGSFGNTDPADLTRVSDSSGGFSLSGAWRLNDHWAIDLEYADNGGFDGYNTCPPELLCIAAESPEVVDARTVTLSVLGELPVRPDWNLFARLGYADTDLDRRYAADVDDREAVVGAGFSWLYSPRSRLALEYRSEAADMERLGLSLRHRF